MAESACDHVAKYTYPSLPLTFVSKSTAGLPPAGGLFWCSDTCPSCQQSQAALIFLSSSGILTYCVQHAKTFSSLYTIHSASVTCTSCNTAYIKMLNSICGIPSFLPCCCGWQDANPSSFRSIWWQNYAVYIEDKMTVTLCCDSGIGHLHITATLLQHSLYSMLFGARTCFSKSCVFLQPPRRPMFSNLSVLLGLLDFCSWVVSKQPKL